MITAAYLFSRHKLIRNRYGNLVCSLLHKSRKVTNDGRHKVAMSIAVQFTDGG